VVDDEGLVVSFVSEAEAHRQLSGNSVSPEASALYDFDALLSWCHSEGSSVDRPTVLDVWNFLADLPRENQLFTTLDVRSGATYDKLFHGCNLPAMGASPIEYVPTWTSAEIAALKHLIMLGIHELCSRCRSW